MRDMYQPLPDRPIERVPPGPLIAQGHAALRRATESPAELTVALLCFHIAIEQIGRELLAQHPGSSGEERERAWMESLSWGKLLAALQRHGLISRELRTTLTTLNDERNDLCHRQPMYPGFQEQVERYGAAADLLSSRVELDEWEDLVPDRKAIDNATLFALAQAQAAARPPTPSQVQPAEDLLAQMLAAPV